MPRGVGWSYLSEYMGWVRKPDPAVVAQQQQEQKAAQQQVQQQAATMYPAGPARVFPAPGRDARSILPFTKPFFIPAAAPPRSFQAQAVPGWPRALIHPWSILSIRRPPRLPPWALWLTASHLVEHWPVVC